MELSDESSPPTLETEHCAVFVLRLPRADGTLLTIALEHEDGTDTPWTPVNSSDGTVEERPDGHSA